MYTFSKRSSERDDDSNPRVSSLTVEWSISLYYCQTAIPPLSLNSQLCSLFSIFTNKWQYIQWPSVAMSTFCTSKSLILTTGRRKTRVQSVRCMKEKFYWIFFLWMWSSREVEQLNWAGRKEIAMGSSTQSANRFFRTFVFKNRFKNMFSEYLKLLKV